MHNDSPNPYQAPASRSPPEALTFRISASVASIVWATLSLAIWFAGNRLNPVFQDFDLKLPLVTRMMLHPGCTLATAAIAILLAVAAFNANPRQRYVVATLSFGVAFIFVLVAAYAVLWPLVILIEGLDQTKP